MPEIVQPSGWPRPTGYAQGVAAAGKLLAIAGQVGKAPGSTAMAKGFEAQFAQALDNLLAVVRAGGGQATDVVSLTIYLTDQSAYRAAQGSLSVLWRARFQTYYPAMTVVEVKGLLEPGALMEIQGLAVIG